MTKTEAWENLMRVMADQVNGPKLTGPNWEIIKASLVELDPREHGAEKEKE